MRNLAVPKEILEQNILDKFKILLFHNKNTFFMRRAFRELLEECEKQNVDYFPLLKKAINGEKLASLEGIELPEIGLSTEEQRSKARKCSLCGHRFENGENAWKGYKKVCKEPCTLKDLKICG